MPRNLTSANFQSKTENQGLSISDYMSRGAVPPELLGVHGNGGFSSIAHRVKQLKEIDNLVNNGVSDELHFKVSDKNGDVKTPFMFQGKLMRPDANGVVRITDTGKIAMAHKIDAYRKERTKKVMETVRLGDDIACYLFGISEANWKKLCGPNVTDADLTAYGIKMHADLKKLDCTVEYIESLPPSLTQTQSIAKLNKICQALEKNVNEDDLTTISDAMSNMKDGHNNPNTITQAGHPMATEVGEFKAHATNNGY